jgi:hypothetical protein
MTFPIALTDNDDFRHCSLINPQHLPFNAARFSNLTTVFVKVHAIDASLESSRFIVTPQL